MDELSKRENLFPIEVARYLGISLTTLYEMLSMNEVPGFKVGHQWRINRTKFLEWYEKKQMRAI